MTLATSLWVYLSGSPLLWLAVTLVAYSLADRAALASGRHPLANPVVIAVALIALVLLVTRTPFGSYFAGAQFVHFLLGPATVALAVPLWRMRREVRATANRLANFDDANLRRSARAAVAAGARVERALELLGDDIPDHLREAGELRIMHKQASLEELGQLATPPMTKDAVAGRIRRLLAMADKHAADLGIPGTEANLTSEMIDG